MKNEIFDNMLSRYDLTTEQQKRNAIFEVNQQVILAGLYAGGFFESAAFYGGTCLRIFHGLTGGVYKARERIHRAMADARLLANPASWGRVADPSPN